MAQWLYTRPARLRLQHRFKVQSLTQPYVRAKQCSDLSFLLLSSSFPFFGLFATFHGNKVIIFQRNDLHLKMIELEVSI